MIRFKIPLSKYSNHEIKEAYNRKISFGESKTKTQLEIHESFQVRDAVQKKPSYSVTLSLKVGGGQDQIILLEAAKNSDIIVR